MKVFATITLLVLIVFLVLPTVAFDNAVVGSNDCCNQHQTKKENKEDCNPFVNCCYRTFEITNQFLIKKPLVANRELVYQKISSAIQQGFSNDFWHPPRQTKHYILVSV